MNAEARITRPLLRYFGGKARLASWIVPFLPPHTIYVEPYLGAGSILFRKPRAPNEIINDLDGEVVNLFRVLRGPRAEELIRGLRFTPYARDEQTLAHAPVEDEVERARRLVVRSHMSHGTGGTRLDRQKGFRKDGPSGATDVAGEWAAMPAQLRLMVDRLAGVTIENMDALELVRVYSDPKALIYADPPYVHQTRQLGKLKGGEAYHVYGHEMTDEDHGRLLGELVASKSMVVLSGYDCPLYAEALQGWRRVDKAARSHRNSHRVESLWINRAALAAGAGGPLFAGPE
jgi:DNA adenine methylase